MRIKNLLSAAMVATLAGCPLQCFQPIKTNHTDGGSVDGGHAPHVCMQGIPAAGACGAGLEDAGPPCSLNSTAGMVPNMLAGSSSAISGNYVYVLGGAEDMLEDQGSTVVYVATIGANGALGNFTAGGTLPSNNGNPGMAFAGLAANNGFLYLVGGSVPTAEGETVLNTVFYSRILANGEVTTPWTAGPTLPTARSHGAVTVLNGFLYSVGGHPALANGGLGDALDEASGPVYVAPINSDGSLGAWVDDADGYLPAGRANFSLVSTGKFLYAIGGLYAGYSVLCDTNRVMVATQNTDGTLICWSPATGFSDESEAGAAVIMGNSIVTFLGRAGSMDSAGSQKVLMAQFNSNGSINGPWQDVAEMPEPGFYRSVAGNSTDIYSMTGQSSNGPMAEVDRLTFAAGNLTCP